MSNGARQDEPSRTPEVSDGERLRVRDQRANSPTAAGGEELERVELEGAELDRPELERPELDRSADANLSESGGADTAADPPAFDRLGQCEERLGYVFRDKALLRAALTHASGAEHRLASNERLEFLGDAVLGFVVCDILFRNYPAFQEGELTRVKSSVVSRQTCAKLSAQLGLHEFLILGKGMASSGAVPQSLMADVFESLVAAMYLDGGDEVARDFLGRSLAAEIASAVALAHSDNAKSLLQQIAQRRFGATPSYHLLDEKGPDHSKCFKMSARAGSRDFSPAWGRNKKEAEQRAACNALAELNGEPAPFLEEA